MVLDTHMWIWFNVGDPRISSRVLTEIKHQGVATELSAWSIWETMLLLQKGRLLSTMSPEKTIRTWLQASPMRVVPVDTDITILSRTLAFKHDDPADRIIAATAYKAAQPLATLDEKLTSLPWLVTIS